MPEAVPHNEEQVPEYAETVAHARAGYSNAQDIIKFIDTKSGVVTGLVTVSLGLPFLVIQWLAEQETDAFLNLEQIAKRSQWLAGISMALLILGIGAGLFALLKSLSGLLPRSPAARMDVTILFPMFHPTRNKRKALKSLTRLTAGLSQKEVLREYEIQLFRVGQILHEKTQLLHQTGKWFGWQVGLYFLSLACLLVGRMF